MTRFIDEQRQTYGVGSICKILPIAPSVYYATVSRQKNPCMRSQKDKVNKPGFTDAELETVLALNRAEFPLADVDSLMAAGWPKATGIKARAILAVTIYLGAIDFADHKTATYGSIQKREYHHIFPDALLSAAEIPSFLALNCALITWKTNRLIGRKDPLDYLRERVLWADEDAVRERLKSHLISYDLLSKAHYAGMEGAALNQKLKSDFNVFLRNRANLIFAAMISLTDGNSPTLDTLWANSLLNCADEAKSAACALSS